MNEAGAGATRLWQQLSVNTWCSVQTSRPYNLSVEDDSVCACIAADSGACSTPVLTYMAPASESLLTRTSRTLLASHTWSHAANTGVKWPLGQQRGRQRQTPGRLLTEARRIDARQAVTHSEKAPSESLNSSPRSSSYDKVNFDARSLIRIAT